MALNLPAEVQTEKNKVANKPILLVEFADLGVYVGSQEYTLDYGGGEMHTFQDDLLESQPMNFSIDIPQLVNGLSSQASLTLKITDFINTYRASIIGTNPDKTGSEINIYIKYDTSNNLKSNVVKIFSGYLSTYSISRNVMTIKAKTAWPGFESIPKNFVTYKRSAIRSGELTHTPMRPLQYGAGNFDAPPRDWSRDQHYIACPLVNWTGGEKATYWIANHKMHQLPTSTDINNFNDPHMFVVRDNLYCHVNASGTHTISNTSSGAYIDIDLSVDQQVYVVLQPQTEGTNNTVPDWYKAVEGTTSTYCTVNDTNIYVLHGK